MVVIFTGLRFAVLVQPLADCSVMVGIVLSAGCHIGRQPVDVVSYWSGMSIAVQPIPCPKKNILILPKTAAGVLPPVILTGICFFSSLSYLWANFAPYKGRFQPIHWAELALWTGRKLHLIGQLQENTFARFQPCRTRIISPAFSNSANAALTVRSLRFRSFAICRIV